MSKSLQDQLLGAGLVDKKKAKAISKQKNKQKKVQNKAKQPVANELQESVEQARLDKLAKDRELNQRLQEEAQQKAIRAQIIQLIQMNRLNRKGGELAFNFKDGSLVKKIHVNQPMLDQLSNGRLCVVKLEDGYEVVPRPVAEKIAEREEDFVLVNNSSSSNQVEEVKEEEDDYYAQFEIPDDLMW